MKKQAIANTGLYYTKLTAKIILFWITILTQQNVKFNKTPQVYILLADESDEFWRVKSQAETFTLSASCHFSEQLFCY